MNHPGADPGAHRQQERGSLFPTGHDAVTRFSVED